MTVAEKEPWTSTYIVKWETGRVGRYPGFGRKHEEKYSNLDEAIKFARMRDALPEFKHVQLLEICVMEIDYK